MVDSAFFRCLRNFYAWMVRFFSSFQSIFLFLLRLVWGHQFFLAGLSKWQNLPATASFFKGLSLPWPFFSASSIAFIECIGGLCLVLGLASRFVSFWLACVMVGAYSVVHNEIFRGFTWILHPTSVVNEPPFAFLMTSLLVLFFGPGKISLDGWIKRWILKKDRFG